MKKIYTSLFVVFVTYISLFAQVPEAFNYQAVVRNSSGEIIPNTNVAFRISILQGSETGTAVYVETHSVFTNNFGLVNLKIGMGSVQEGVFMPGDWGAVNHFIKVEFDKDGGTGYEHLGTSPLLSVPYAFHAQTVAEDAVDDADSDPNNEIQTLQLSGTQLSLSKNGGTVTLPSSGGGDNWGTQTVISDATLLGEGTTANPLKVANTTFQPDWANIQNKPGGFADNNDDVEDGDANPNNEIQTLSISGNDLTISDGNTVSLPAGVSSPWQTSGNDIFFNSGNVGIGTQNPLYKLDVRETDKIAIYGKSENLYGILGESKGMGAAGVLGEALSPNSWGVYGHNSFGGIAVRGLSSGNGYAGHFWGDAGATAGYFYSDYGYGLIVEKGNIGLGTDHPVEKLHIQEGNIQVDQGYGLKLLNNTNFSEIKSFGNDLNIISYSTGNIHFHTNESGLVSYKRMTIKNNGNVGIGTETPSHNLTISGTNNETQICFQNSSSGNSVNDGFLIGMGNPLNTNICYVWNYENGSLGFGTNNKLRMQINPNGNTVIGDVLSNPAGEEILNIVGANPRLLIEATSSNPEINFKNTGDVASSIWSIYKNGSTGDLHFYQNGNKLTLQKNTGNLGIGTNTPQGKLDVNGAIYQRGGTLHADYVFEENYQLETIAEHAEFIWKNKHLPAIPKATVDENGFEIIEVGSHRKGIVEELEKAHIYISQLEKKLNEQNTLIQDLMTNADKKELLKRIETLEKLILSRKN